MKAVQLDDSLAEAHASLGDAEWTYDWDWPSAEREYKRAIELNPNSAISHGHYVVGLLTRARFDESIAEGERAQELDPLLPTELPYAYLVAHRYDEAISRYQKTLDLYPDMAYKRAELGWAYAMKGMYTQAIGEYDKMPESALAPENQLVASGLGWVYAVAGRRTDALKIAKEFKDLSSHAYVDCYQFATIYAGLGDKDEAFRLLEQAYKEHSGSMIFLAVDPFWYEMRSDPRYADLLRRMGLPQPE
jgi:tetratricopeptide (TPR) repeat protein